MKFIGNLGKFTWLSYIGVVLSLIGMNYLIQGQVTLALIVYIGAGVCDLFDGVVARRMDRSQEDIAFGFELDSLCDMVSFAAFPAVFITTVSNNSIMSTLIAFLFVLAGINRLAYFNSQERESTMKNNPSAYFIGLPVTYTALVLPVAHVLIFDLRSTSYQLVMSLIMLTLSVLFITNKPIAKPDKKSYQLLMFLAIMTLIALGSHL